MLQADEEQVRELEPKHDTTPTDSLQLISMIAFDTTMQRFLQESGAAGEIQK